MRVGGHELLGQDELDVYSSGLSEVLWNTDDLEWRCRRCRFSENQYIQIQKSVGGI